MRVRFFLRFCCDDALGLILYSKDSFLPLKIKFELLFAMKETNDDLETLG